MAPRSALTPEELTALADGHAARWYLAAVANTVIATATVSAFSDDGLTITVTGTSAGWSGVNADMTFEVSNGSTSRGVYRIRWKGADATHLYPMELSLADPGAIAQTIRTAGISAGDTITVYRRRDFWSVIPRIDAAAGTIYEDGDETVTSDNTHPGPVINITIAGADGRISYGDFAAFVDSGQTYATITFTVTPVLWPTSSSVSSYAWTAPTAWGSPTAGSISSASVTYRVPVGGQTNYELICAVFDDILQARVGYRNVWVFDRASNAPISIAALDSLELTEQGARASLTLNDNTLASIPQKGNKVLLFHDATFNGSVVPSAWTSVSGWVTHLSEQTDTGLRSASIDIDGPAGMLTKLGAYSQYVTAINSTPQNAQEIWASLASMDYQTFWLASLRGQNTVATHNWSALGLIYTSQDLPVWKLDATGNLFSQMQTIALTRQCSFGFNPDGEAMVKKIPGLVAYADRGSDVIKRGTLTPSIYSKVTFGKDPRPKVRRDRGEAFTWDGSATQPMPLLADAPGNAPGQGTGDDRLQSQIVDSQSEHDQVTGDDFAMKNNPYADIELEIPGLWGLVMNPAEQNFWGLTVPAADSPDGVAKSLNIILRSVSLRSEGGGAFTTTVRAYAETHGVTAVTVLVPTQAITPTPLNSLPTPISVTTPLGTPRHNGSTVIVWTGTKLAITFNYFDDTPNWIDITGTGLTNVDANWSLRLDPFSPFLAGTGNTLGAYAVTVDGMFYCTNLLTTSPVWVLKHAVTSGGKFIHARPSNNYPGEVALVWRTVYPPDAGTLYAQWLQSYGASTLWTATQAIDMNHDFGMDIDSYGSREIWTAAKTGSPEYLWNVLNGVGTLIDTRAAGWGDGTALFIQKPLLTFSGAANNGTGSSATLVLAQFFSNQLWKTSNGGGSFTAITPANGILADANINSLAFTTNSNVIISPAANSSTTLNAGTSWTATGNNFNKCGYFPRSQNGSYAIYGTGLTGLIYSPDFGVTLQDKTGDWTSAIEVSPTFLGVIPLY
jgi:hypothetical protein